MRIILRLGYQPRTHRITPDVFAMPGEILAIPDPMIRKTRLPDRQTRLQSKRKPSLDELHSPLQRYLIRRCNQGMEMIGHNHKVMEQIFPLLAIVEKDFSE